jgi:hypothetical protein
MWRQQFWELHTHGGFVTYPHHDAAGLCTYVYPRSGAKLWTVITPHLKDYSDRKALFEDMDKLGFYSNFDHFEQRETILLEEGHLL